MLCVEEDIEEENLEGARRSPELITPLDMEPNLSKSILSSDDLV